MWTDLLSWRFWGARLGQAVVAAVLLAAALFALDRVGYLSVNSSLKSEQTSAPAGSAETETLFLNGLASKPDRGDEWWMARADHRLVAAAVLNCKHIAGVTMTRLPREYFSALLLDLEPGGAHVFRATAASTAAPSNPLMLTSADQFVLSLSDEVARARIDAASGAEASAPFVQKLGLSTVIVAALATLFVTLQGKMKPVEMPEEEKSNSLRRRVSYVLWGPGALFRWVAFFAISLSITSTALTGLKQVYDPTRTLTQNTRTLLALRQLHADIIQGVVCGGGGGTTVQTIALSPTDSGPKWTAAFRLLRAAIIPDYGAYANVDLATASNRNGPEPAPAPGTPNPKEEVASQPIAASPAPAEVSANGNPKPK